MVGERGLIPTQNAIIDQLRLTVKFDCKEFAVID
jgi:hypothetical protein